MPLANSASFEERKTHRLAMQYSLEEPKRNTPEAISRIKFLSDDRFVRGGVVVEVGVLVGLFSELILEKLRPRELHLVDPWLNDGTDPGSKPWLNLEAQYQSVLRRFCKRKDVVKVHRIKSVEASLKFADGSLDFVYIDGNHVYEYVLLDCLLWWPKVKPGGFLAGHDYIEVMRCEQWNPKKGIDHFSCLIGIAPTTMGGLDWFIQRFER